MGICLSCGLWGVDQGSWISDRWRPMEAAPSFARDCTFPRWKASVENCNEAVTRRYGEAESANARSQHRAWVERGCFWIGVVFVHRDVEAGLAELLFHIDLALLLEGCEPCSQPADFTSGQAFFGDVDGTTGKVGRGDIAIRSGGVAVDVAQAALVFHGANGGGDLDERAAELPGVSGGEVA